MDTNQLISQTRQIVKTHYEGMERLDMEASDPEMLKEDLCEKLRAYLPQLQHSDLQPLYQALQEKGYATLITTDTVTFSKDFIG